jgi:hypothetical protein
MTYNVCIAAQWGISNYEQHKNEGGIFGVYDFYAIT